MLVIRMQFNLSYTIWSKNLVHGLLQKKKGFEIWFIFHLLQMYIYIYIKRSSIKCC